MRYLGIDYGSKKIGIAFSDEAGAMGFPHGIITNTPGTVDEVAKLLAEKGAEAIVVGESRDLSGAENPIAADAKAFAAALAEKTGKPVYWEAEFYTSAEARRARDASVEGRSPKNTDAVDASAAALILTSYLSKKHD